MYKKVLIPILSTPSMALLERIKVLKEAGLKDLYLLSVVEVPSLASTYYIPEFMNEYKKLAKTILEEVEEQIDSGGINVETRVNFGTPSKEILSLADEEDVDLIVMGARGESFLEQFLGSVTTQVVNHSKCPVLVEQFKEEKTEEDTVYHLLLENPFEHVLYVTDFSQKAAQVLAGLKEIKHLCKKVTVFHARDRRKQENSNVQKNEMNNSDIDRMNQIVEELQGAGIENVAIEINTGHPVSVIPAAVKNLDATLIAMASKGRTNLSTVLLGSTAMNVLRKSPVPVLLWK